MGKLTERQKKKVIADYATGGFTQAQLAAKYNVDRATINRIIKRDPDFATKCNNLKKEQEKQEYQDLADFFAKKNGHLVGRIAKALDVSDEALDASSPRDRCGFAKVVAELIILMKHERDEGKDTSNGDKLEVVFVDNSKKDDGEEG